MLSPIVEVHLLSSEEHKPSAPTVQLPMQHSKLCQDQVGGLVGDICLERLLHEHELAA